MLATNTDRHTNLRGQHSILVQVYGRVIEGTYMLRLALKYKGSPIFCGDWVEELGFAQPALSQHLKDSPLPNKYGDMLMKGILSLSSHFVFF